MTALIWNIKTSLVHYVSGMADGTVTLADGAEHTAAGFRFPSIDRVLPGALTDRTFTGTVRMQGHSGMLRLQFARPRVETADDGSISVSFDDPDEFERQDDAPAQLHVGRLCFASVTSLTAEADGSLRGTGVALTEAGADLFFGPYEEGTTLDDFLIVPDASPTASPM